MSSDGILSLDEVRSLQGPGMSSGEELQKQVQAKAGWISERLKREFDRYRISLSLGLKGEEIGDNDALNANAYYRVMVDANYRDGEHVRHDTYVFGLAFNDHLHFGSQLRVTFTRTFSGPNAKIDAIMAKPYWIGKVPLDSDDFKKQLRAGDSVRLELLGSLGLGWSDGAESGDVEGSIGFSYGRDALFMMDAYKHSDTVVRLRFLGVRNSGTLGVRVRAERPSILSDLPSNIRRLFEIGVGVDLTTTLGLSDLTTIESWVIDYGFRFESPLPGVSRVGSPEAALDGLLDEMRRFGFGSIFSPGHLAQSRRSWFERSLAVASSADSFGGPASGARVQHLFKGRMRSSLAGIELKGRVSELLRASLESGSMTSFVESEQPDGTIQYYVLDNSFGRSRGRALFGRHDDLEQYDTDFLIRSNANGDLLDTLDIIVRKETRGKVLSGSELRRHATAFESLLPGSLRGSGRIEAFIPRNKQRNARLVSQLSFSQAALDAFGQRSRGEIAVALQSFLESHPERSQMHLPSDSTEASMSFGDVVESYTYKLDRAFDGHETPTDRWKAISALQGDLVFQKWILPEFLTSLLSGADSDRMVRLRLDFSSDETPSGRLEIGKNAVSSVYATTSFVRTVLSTRDFDLRDETIQAEQNGTLK